MILCVRLRKEVKNFLAIAYRLLAICRAANTNQFEQLLENIRNMTLA